MPCLPPKLSAFVLQTTIAQLLPLRLRQQHDPSTVLLDDPEPRHFKLTIVSMRYPYHCAPPLLRTIIPW